MGMNFTLDITGKVRLNDVDASGAEGIDAEEVFNSAVSDDGVEPLDAEVIEATVTVEASLIIRDVEVSAADLGEFDAEQAIDERFDSGTVNVITADYEITDSPSGFDQLVGVLGRDTAIEVYATLAASGFEVL